MKQPVFGDILRAARKAQGMSQMALSERSGVTQNAITKIENGINYPNLLTMRLLANGLGAQPVIGFKMDPEGETT
jgi:transcriptional regulator with XRE-family HTH domain